MNTISELVDGAKKVELIAKVIDIGETREVQSRYTNEKFNVANATIEDETGTIVLVLWDDEIMEVTMGDTVVIVNGYVKSFRDVLQLNVGKYGTLTVQ
jgi:replication factor A1